MEKSVDSIEIVSIAGKSVGDIVQIMDRIVQHIANPRYMASQVGETDRDVVACIFGFVEMAAEK